MIYPSVNTPADDHSLSGEVFCFEIINKIKKKSQSTSQ